MFKVISTDEYNDTVVEFTLSNGKKSIQKIHLVPVWDEDSLQLFLSEYLTAYEAGLEVQNGEV